MSKRCELQKEYYKEYGNYKGEGKYCDKYVKWLEEQVLNLQISSWRVDNLSCKLVNKLDKHYDETHADK